MNDFRLVESGKMGRVAYGRIAPNEDLILGIEKLCLAQGFKNAFVRGALGSLVDACLEEIDDKIIEVKGPAVEIVSLAGEVRSDENGTPCASLSGVVAGPDGKVYGGRFVLGLNPICVTFEVTLEEWLPDT
jgi:predicted DNA-binding protein with PD1-like motif